MRIGIDVQPLQTGTRYAGVGCFLRNIIQQISRMDTVNEYVLCLNNSDYLETVTPPAPGWQTCHVARKHRLGRLEWIWDTIYLPALLSQKNIDIYQYNSLSENEPLAPPFPFGKHRIVATIHDLIPLRFPDQCSSYFSKSLGSFDYRAKLRRIMHADAIITVSEHSRQDIQAFCAYPEDRIFVAYNGISDYFRQIPTEDQLCQFRQIYSLPENFLLYLGGYYAGRKNISRLLEAYKLLIHSDISPTPKLVLAGLSNPEHRTRICTKIHERRLDRYIITLPFIPDEELPLLYRSAAILIYPSLYEGFGMPVAEAMACGTVVVTSNVSSLPEIAGDAGIYCDPYNVNSIAEMIYKSLTDVSLRARVAQAGPQRARRFTWEQTAQTILSVYEQVYRG